MKQKTERETYEDFGEGAPVDTGHRSDHRGDDD
jgi:hypothetical protein